MNHAVFNLPGGEVSLWWEGPADDILSTSVSDWVTSRPVTKAELDWMVDMVPKIYPWARTVRDYSA
jgi:hypothetical protein